MDRPPLRLLHCADVHLTYIRREESLETIAALAEAADASQADCLLIAGDLFDSTNQPDEFVDDVAEAVSAFGVPLVAIPGNHDIQYSDRDGDAFGSLFAQLDGRATVLVDGEGTWVVLNEGRLQVWGRGMPEHTPENDPLAGLPRVTADGSWHVALAHGYLMDRPNGRSSPIIPARHRAALQTFDYVALGHHHLATQLTFEGTLITDSGSPTAGTRRRTYAIVDLAEGSVTSVIHQLDLPQGPGRWGSRTPLLGLP
jgi:DNA repair exonuclease SbcCD nuclease subunit